MVVRNPQVNLFQLFKNVFFALLQHLDTTSLVIFENHNYCDPSMANIAEMPSPSPTSIAEAPMQPIIFKFPGLKVDTRLKVFGQEYHVHSHILKLYSAFFRTFLDSPDKTPAPASALFRYEYVSVVDDDGTWGLEVALKRDDQNAVPEEAGNSPTPSESVSQPKVCNVWSNSRNILMLFRPLAPSPATAI